MLLLFVHFAKEGSERIKLFNHFGVVIRAALKPQTHFLVFFVSQEQFTETYVSNVIRLYEERKSKIMKIQREQTISELCFVFIKFGSKDCPADSSK